VVDRRGSGSGSAADPRNHLRLIGALKIFEPAIEVERLAKDCPKIVERL
jgi:hypothetical protein